LLVVVRLTLKESLKGKGESIPFAREEEQMRHGAFSLISRLWVRDGEEWARVGKPCAKVQERPDSTRH
jgi:hypothetical protein